MKFRIALSLLVIFAAVALLRNNLPEPLKAPLGLTRNISEIRARQTPQLTEALAAKGLRFGAPLYIRIFKEEAELELWVLQDESYARFKTYPICAYSGQLGPKLKEGDRQAPEGFYTVAKSALNPNSSYHLSFNLGFPNAYDRALGRTGSFLMVHGACVSIGCYAMTDPSIEEIYILTEAALAEGQSSVPVHAFPFRMTASRLAQETGTKWYTFWQSLAPAYRHFETTKHPPNIQMTNGTYQVTP